ncbi:hypothetical protein EVAR_31980_1 [Eumeta japonica]|uniref:Uncharacterized protein n=1 Tax=Eumeta variegata TaxID=151549 RepID=A0A4C1VSJ2_EUMVA|nr:hypothetical protein EVAR_31980_1 [Eumeta japonica]
MISSPTGSTKMRALKGNSFRKFNEFSLLTVHKRSHRLLDLECDACTCTRRIYSTGYSSIFDAPSTDSRRTSSPDTNTGAARGGAVVAVRQPRRLIDRPPVTRCSLILPFGFSLRYFCFIYAAPLEDRSTPTAGRRIEELLVNGLFDDRHVRESPCRSTRFENDKIGFTRGVRELPAPAIVSTTHSASLNISHPTNRSEPEKRTFLVNGAPRAVAAGGRLRSFARPASPTALVPAACRANKSDD